MELPKTTARPLDQSSSSSPLSPESSSSSPISPESSEAPHGSTNKGLLGSNAPYGDPGQPEKVEPP